jgi:hypothetical protein
MRHRRMRMARWRHGIALGPYMTLVGYYNALRELGGAVLFQQFLLQHRAVRLRLRERLAVGQRQRRDL